jgi:hypothetical protein
MYAAASAPDTMIWREVFYSNVAKETCHSWSDI